MNGYGENNVLIVSQESGFINSNIFSVWSNEIFFPEIQRKRSETGYTGMEIILLDGCTSHFGDFFLDECSYFNVFPFQEPSGTSDQVLVLDLGVFGVQKHFKSKVKVDKCFNELSTNIIQIFNSICLSCRI